MELLFIDGCISQRGPGSRTRALADAFLSAFREGHPEAAVETVSLEALDLRPFLPPALDERDALASIGAFDAPVFWRGSAGGRTPSWRRRPSGT